MPSAKQRKLIHHGDCVDVLKRIPDETIDFVLTDPPYLVNYRDRSGRSIQNDNNDQWVSPAFQAITRVLKNDHLVVCFYPWNHTDVFLRVWRDVGLTPVGHLVFPKSYKSNRAGYLEARHEQAYLLAKGKPEKPKRPLSDVQSWHYTGNAWHPTQPAHHNAEAYLDAYLQATGLKDEPASPLFRSVRKGKLTARPVSRNDALAMVKRRARRAGLPPALSSRITNHT